MKIELETAPSFSRILRSAKGVFILDITYNSYGGFYVLNIRNNERLQVASGLRLQLGHDILRGFVSPNTPDGSLILYSTSAKIAPRYDNIGDYYLEYMDW